MALTPRALQLLRRQARAGLGLPITVPNESPAPPVIKEEPPKEEAAAPKNKNRKEKKPKSEASSENDKESASKSKVQLMQKSGVKKGKRKVSESEKSSETEPEAKKSQKKKTSGKDTPKTDAESEVEVLSDAPSSKVSLKHFVNQFRPTIDDLEDEEWNNEYKLPTLATYPEFNGKLSIYYNLETLLKIVKIFDFNTNYLSILTDAEFHIAEFDLLYASLMANEGQANIYQMYITSLLSYAVLKLNTTDSNELPPLTFANAESIIDRAFKELPDFKTDAQFDYLSFDFNQKIEFLEALIEYISDHKQFAIEIETYESKRQAKRSHQTTCKNYIQALESSIKKTQKDADDLKSEVAVQSALKTDEEKLNKMKQELALKVEWLEKKREFFEAKQREIDQNGKFLVKGFTKGVNKTGLMTSFKYYQMFNLGQDRVGRYYWHWPFLGGIWVQEVNVESELKDKWYVINSKPVLDNLIDNLNRRGFREANLFKILARHQKEIESSFDKYEAWLEYCKKLEKLNKLPDSVEELLIERALLFSDKNRGSVGKESDENVSQSNDDQSNEADVKKECIECTNELHLIKLDKGTMLINSKSNTIEFNSNSSELFFGPLITFSPYKNYTLSSTADSDNYECYLIKSITKLLNQLTAITFDYLTDLGVMSNNRLSKTLRTDISSIENLENCIDVFKLIVDSTLQRIQNYLVLNSYIKDHYKILKIRVALKKFSTGGENSKLTAFSFKFLGSFTKVSWWLSRLLLELDSKSFNEVSDSSAKSKITEEISHCKVHMQGVTQYPCHNHFNGKNPKFVRKVKLIGVKVTEKLDREWPEVKKEEIKKED
ncbi:hypothetical protein CONCODRAFT_79948 [Conidiobolus coronatus NRRL 28638]|uniref:WHIM2 domain-containing protein n=1 Tax=Conidiobolus coronatus (strain ATCC 28846 / CBS 209.66 / NRRL 28638) TaxID=796925 RepID=A0A137NZC0_CONC2|nr:hypothetical protein CONCODRAFT_79948 [Conidiobolus coronatus NRRL 28638]|eukprot:KXN67974.1 hypothetical protein CONCODRAFT_79948 [Conidiobolus coronatus NRRL 28638]